MIKGLILARGGTKGLPNKSLLKLGKKTLITLAIEKLSQVCEVWFSSDSDIYNEEAGRADAHIIKRPIELAQDNTPAINAIKHAIPHIKDFEILILYNLCCPLTAVEDIRGALELMEDADSVTSLVLDFSVHPSKTCYLDGNRILPMGEFSTSQRQEKKEIYKRNAALYLAKKEVILSGRLFGDNLKGYVMPRFRSIDINDEFDFKIA